MYGTPPREFTKGGLVKGGFRNLCVSLVQVLCMRFRF